jgi:pathogenesis-related protein 1
MSRYRRYFNRFSMVFFMALPLLTVSMTACAVPGSLPGVSTGARLSPEEAGRIVSLHNQIRAEVGVGPLRWSEEVAGYAQQWADHLASTRCGMQHRPRSGKWQQQYGENLFIGTVGHYGTADAVRAWASEKSSYRGGAIHASGFARIGHYTQMVWRETRKIGCATAVCRNNLIVVCNYDPPGNFVGQRPY